VPDPDAVKAAIADGSGFIALPRRPRAEEPAPDTPVLLHAPTARPSDTRFPTQRHGTSGNPHVALVRDHLFQAARDW
jgi:hypothetical protein